MVGDCTWVVQKWAKGARGATAQQPRTGRAAANRRERRLCCSLLSSLLVSPRHHHTLLLTVSAVCNTSGVWERSRLLHPALATLQCWGSFQEPHSIGWNGRAQAMSSEHSVRVPGALSR